MSDEIKVEFPRKMEVDAPRTDSYLDRLLDALRDLSRTVEAALGRVVAALEVLRQVPELVKQFREEVVTQFGNLFYHQMEAQVMARQAAILSAKKKKEAILQYQEEKTRQLDQDCERIKDRYRQILGQLAEECEVRIRRLDSHALEILERLYPEQVQATFRDRMLPVVDRLSEHAVESSEIRERCLRDGLGDAVKAVKAFLDARQDLGEAVELCVVRGAEQPAAFALPLLAVTAKDAQTGETAVRIVPHPSAAGFAGLPLPAQRALLTMAERAAAQASRAPLGADDRAALAAALGAVPDVRASDVLRFRHADIQWLAGPEGEA